MLVLLLLLLQLLIPDGGRIMGIGLVVGMRRATGAVRVAR